MKINEQALWYYLDIIATRESACGGSRAKAEAAVAMMQHLAPPTPQECRGMYDAGYKVERPLKNAA